jgi:hypothetical protein
MSNTILIGPAGIRKERKRSTVVVEPGMLLAYTTALAVLPHSSAAGMAKPMMVAIEEPENSGRDIDDGYDVTGEIVQCDFPLPGQDRYMWLAAGETASKGSDLNSDGAGALQVGSTNKVATALEAVNNSAGYVPVRIKVEVC